jgi:hypothetical protein
MGDNLKLSPRRQAQETIYHHINWRRGAASKHDYNFIHVIGVKFLDAGNWVAIVEVEGIDDLFKATYTKISDETKVETFSRRGTIRFYKGDPK